MAKKKSSSNLWYCIACLLALAAIIMIFVPSLKIVSTISDEILYSNSGLQAVFGYETTLLTIYSFSFMNLLTYILVLAGLVLVALKIFNVTKSKIVDFVSMCLFLVAGIFFFLMPVFAVSPYASDLGSLVSINLSVGAIISGILSILAACALCVKEFVKK